MIDQIAIKAMAENREIKASVLHSAGKLSIETQHIPPPAPHEVQVAVSHTGLCGSDLHYYRHGRNGDFQVRQPLTLGHESAGTVVAVGSAVDGFRVGDRVALEVGQPCGDCARCREGRYNICKELKFRSSAKSFPHAQGTLAQRINQPAAWCHLLPDGLSLEMGALLEPLGVAVHAARRSRLVRGEKVVVFGAGAVGLLCAAVARSEGASEVAIADIDEGRVKFAVENRFATAGYVVPMKRGADTSEELEIAKDTAKSIGALSSREGEVLGEVDAAFECTGVPSCVQASIYATRPGGRALLVGMGNPVYALPVSAAALREVDLLGVFRYANTYPKGIEVMSKLDADSPDLSKLVTHRFQGFERIEEAFQMAGKTEDGQGKLVLKVMVQTSDDDSSVRV